MPTKTIVCPSGLTGEIRNLKAKEMSILADGNGSKPAAAGKKKGAKRAHPLDPIFAGCWLSTTDPGPYKLGEDGNLVWPKVVAADRTFILVHIRDLTWGAYEFKVRCPDTDCDGHKGFVWSIDLNQLESAELSPESIDSIRTGHPFEIEIGGKKCTYRLSDGEHEMDLAAVQETAKGPDNLLAQVALRLLTIEGVKPADKIAWVGELDMPDLYRASEEMGERDGGIETRTVAQCPECEVEFTVDVPFADGPFLAPPPQTKSTGSKPSSIGTSLSPATPRT